MNYARYRRQTAIITTFGVLIFIILTTFTLYWANGLKFDPTNRTFAQTSVVSVETELENIEILLNGKKVASEAPYQVRNLSPGRYELSVTKDGYHPYQRTFTLGAGEVGIAEDIDLIAIKPLVTDLPESARFISPTKFSNRIVLQGGDLIDGTEFITRFSIVPVQVHRFSSFYLYQQGKNFHVFVPDTNQDFVVYSASAAKYVPINSIPNSYSFVVNENGKKKLINLTLPSEVAAKPR